MATRVKTRPQTEMMEMKEQTWDQIKYKHINWFKKLDRFTIAEKYLNGVNHEFRILYWVGFLKSLFNHIWSKPNFLRQIGNSDNLLGPKIKPSLFSLMKLSLTKSMKDEAMFSFSEKFIYLFIYIYFYLYYILYIIFIYIFLFDTLQ